MNRMLALALAAATAIGGVSAAEAREGCGPGGHRNPWGECRPNRGTVIDTPAGPRLVVGKHYRGRGYWDGRRYWHHRYRHHGDWRYR